MPNPRSRQTTKGSLRVKRTASSTDAATGLEEKDKLDDASTYNAHDDCEATEGLGTAKAFVPNVVITPPRRKLIKKALSPFSDTKPKATTTLQADKPEGPPKNITLTTTTTKSGDIVAQFRRGDTHAYINPLVDWMNEEDHKKMVFNQLQVHYKTWERHPHSEDMYKTDPPNTKSNFRPRYNIFIMFVPGEAMEKNTPENRERWAKGIMTLANSPAITHKYRFGNNQVSYGGDTAPATKDKLPYLSEFLTLTDTMDAICKSYTDPKSGTEASALEIINDMEVLRKYYKENQIQRVVDKYTTPEAAPGDEFGLGAFVPHFNL